MEGPMLLSSKSPFRCLRFLQFKLRAAGPKSTITMARQMAIRVTRYCFLLKHSSTSLSFTITLFVFSCDPFRWTSAGGRVFVLDGSRVRRGWRWGWRCYRRLWDSGWFWWGSLCTTVVFPNRRKPVLKWFIFDGSATASYLENFAKDLD